MVIVGAKDASTRHFKSADAVMPCWCARAAKRAFVARGTQVIKCVLSLIASATVHQPAAARLSCTRSNPPMIASNETEILC